MQSGELDFARYLQQIIGRAAGVVDGWLDRFGLTDFASIQERLPASLMKGMQFFAAQALNIGQNTLDFLVGLFIMLYLLFFLLRDGARSRAHRAMRCRCSASCSAISDKFTTVVRATIKGNIVVALVQGALGGLIFWFLGYPGARVLGGADGVPVAAARDGYRAGVGARSRSTSW